MNRKDTRMYGPNRFKLGIFAMNCSGGMTMTKAPERWDASWANNVAAARLADAAGIEFLLPIGRWQGYGGETDTQGQSFETLTWASGLLSATTGVSVFGTVHVALINPLFAAKQCVTVDWIGGGRLGLNVVSGWNADEYGMFGVEFREHDDRYGYTEEWVTIVKRLWTEAEPFDFEGRFFSLKAARSNPKPPGGSRPMIMSAGSSSAGRSFAARHADCLFMVIGKLDDLAADIRQVRSTTSGVGVYASGHIVSRPTQKEAEEYYRYIVHEMGDWPAAERLVEMRSRHSQAFTPEQVRSMTERMISGVGTFPIIGSPDYVAETFKRMSDAGLDGMAVGLVNYLNDLPFVRDEILPRMERLGLRQPFRA